MNRLDICRIILDKLTCAPRGDDNEGYTPLHFVYKCPGLAEIYHNKGWDLFPIDNYGKTPLHHSFRNGDASFYQFLLKNSDMDFFHKDDCGQTPFELPDLKGSIK